MQVCCSLTSTTSPYCSSLNACSALQYHKYEYVITATNQVVKKRGCQLPCTFLTRWLTLLLCSAVAPSVMFRCLSLWNVAISELMIGLLITGCWIGIHYTTPPAYKLPFRNLCLGIWCFIIKSFFDLRCADKELKANIPGRVCWDGWRVQDKNVVLILHPFSPFSPLIDGCPGGGAGCSTALHRT